MIIGRNGPAQKKRPTSIFHGGKAVERRKVSSALLGSSFSFNVVGNLPDGL